MFITDRWRPAHVLLSIENYRKLTDQQLSLAGAVAQTERPDFDFSPPRLGLTARPVDLN